MPVPEGVTTNDTKAESKHIRAEDFALDLKIKLKISDVNIEMMPGRDGKPPRKRFNLSFQGKEKSLVLNATNQGFLEVRLGAKPNAWVGSEIIVHRTTTMFGTEVVPAFRIIEAKKGMSPPPSQDSEEVPF